MTAKLTDVHRDINFVIMDYLVSEGYPRAAEKFAKEANIQVPLEEESIQARVEIRQAIHAGDIDTAITMINDLNPQVCYAHVFPPVFLQDYIQFHAPRIIFFDDNQTFSPQYDCKHILILVRFTLLRMLLTSRSDP
jgi:hypothetical protein